MSLLGWYKLDSDFQDYSGYNNNGTLTGTSPTFVPAKIGNGVQFIHPNSTHISIPLDVTKLQGCFSVSCWLKISSLFDFGRIFCYNWLQESGTVDNGLLLFLTTDSIIFGISDGPSGSSVQRNCSYDFTSYLNSWVHVTGICDSQYISLYINGELKNKISTFKNKIFTGVGSSPYIGAYTLNNDNPDGIVTDLRIYDHCLSSKEIFNLSKGLVAHYTFDGCMSDSTGYNPDAKFYNSFTTESSPVFIEDTDVGIQSLKVLGLTNNERCLLPSCDILNGTTDSSYTLCCRVKVLSIPTATTNEWQGCIIAKPGTHSGLGITHNSEFRGTISSTTVSGIGGYSPGATIDSWYNLCMTVDFTNSIVKNYVNGVHATTFSATISGLIRDYASISFSIGTTYPNALLSSTNYCQQDLYIQDVKIFNTVLTDSDIYNLYSTRASLDDSGNIYIYNNTEKYEATNTALSLTPNSVSSSIYSELGPTSGLVGYWPFKTDLNDYSGNNNHFIVTSGTPLFNGIFGKDSCLNVIDGNDMTAPINNLNSTSFSWTGWVNFNDLNNDNLFHVFFAKNYIDSTTPCWRIFKSTSNKIEFDSLPNEIGNLTYSPLLANTWYFVCAIYNAATSSMYLYIDGILRWSPVVSDFQNPSTGVLSVKEMIGYISNYRYYNRVLTSQEINTIYNLEDSDNVTKLKALSVEASISNAANTIFDQWFRFSHTTATSTWNTTSTTSNTIGTGSKTFTIGLDATTNKVGVSYGIYIYSAADPTCYMIGNVTSHVTTTMVASIAVSSGSGTYTDWVVIVSNEYEKYVWKYDPTLSQVICLSNTYGHVGFISDKLFNNYTHEATLSSSNSDDDTIGVIIAFYKDSSWSSTDSWATQITKEHTLSIIRDMGGNSTTGFRLVYNFNKTDAWVISTATVTTLYTLGYTAANTGPGWTGLSPVRVKVVRSGDTIDVWCTEVNTTTPYLESSHLTLDLSSDSRLEKFRGYCSYGYCCLSQYGSTFSDITFTGTMCQVYPKNELKEIYI